MEILDLDIMILDTFTYDKQTIAQVKYFLDFLDVDTAFETIYERLVMLMREGYLYIDQSISSEENGWWYCLTKEGRELWQDNVEDVFSKYDFAALEKEWRSQTTYLFPNAKEEYLEGLLRIFKDQHVPSTEIGEQYQQ